MQRYTTTRPTRMRNVAEADDPDDRRLFLNQVVEDVTEPPTVLGDWQNCQVFNDDGSTNAGWILKANLKPLVGGPAMPPMPNFMIAALDAVYVLNQRPEVASNFASLDLLLVRAIFATDLTYPAPAEGKPIGPFGMRDGEWADFLATCPLGQGIPPHFKESVTTQCRAIAWSIVAAGRLLVSAYGALDQQHEPTYEPDLLDLFLVYLLGNAVDTARCRRAAAASEVTKIDAFLAASSNAPALAIQEHTEFLTDGAGVTLTVTDFVASVYSKLEILLTDAYKILAEHAPTYLAATTGGTPWLDKAIGERGTLESNSAAIRRYFAALKLNRDGSTAWCGAFVAWCLVESETIKASQLPKVAERASNWSDFGRAIPLPVDPTDATLKGAIVVLSPQAAGAGGHVGFLMPSDSKKTVTLLGGNQGNKVNETNFKAEDIRAVRWPDFDQASKLSVGGAKNEVALSLRGYDAHQKDAALLIIRLFAETGYDEMHQRIAVANASAESSLRPAKINKTKKEESVGLFQLNRIGGQGEGFPIEELQDAEFNTRRILIRAKKVGAFEAATEEVSAMEVFIRQIEIAKFTKAELDRRMGIYFGLNA
ncbi:C40 family peptidase [Rhizobium leguminosarum]|uniref:hypothetical protein n=1 Tax=Rhizobium leguminosarum TaxID=384 RepID=UPI001C94EF65|nr:hypothetical protein [Rhizobium leguminosarum]MBY5515657.1 hypothetical protein [Rhizobium leguminosarum]